MASKCRILFHLVSSSRITFIGLRNISVSSILTYEKRPRVLPVCHQVIADHNSQYFTPYPYFTKEEMEEPPPPVSNEVREILEQSRPKWIGDRWIRPKIPPWKFRMKKRELVAAGHDFPDKPMRDRMLDVMPKVQRRVIKKEEKLKLIEENMKMMPQWIAEYKEKRRMEKIKKREEHEKQKINLLRIEKLGLHPKDPRAKQILQGKMETDSEKKKKKKFGEKKKKSDN